MKRKLKAEWYMLTAQNILNTVSAIKTGKILTLLIDVPKNDLKSQIISTEGFHWLKSIRKRMECRNYEILKA